MITFQKENHKASTSYSKKSSDLHEWFQIETKEEKIKNVILYLCCAPKFKPP